MSSAIVAMAGASPEDPLLWFATDSSGRPNTSGEGLLADLASAAGNARIHLLLPGHLVTAHEAHLPSRSEREALIAAPYAIEDQIANDLDDVHLVLAPLGEGGGLLRTAYVVDKSLMEGWIAATRDVGLKLDTIGPDYLALPDGGSTRMVVADLFDRTLLRHGHWGVAVPEDLGQDMAGILAGQRADVEETVQIKAEDLWTEVCQGALKSRINLRRGAFAPRRPRSEFSWRQFRGPVLLALATVMLAIGVNVYEGMSFRAAAADMRADTTAMFRTAFPDVERIVNPRAQLRARLSTRAGSDPEFLIVSAWLALARDAAPGVTIESLRYDNQTGEFVLSVRYGDYTDLGALRSHIEAAGGRVEEGGSRQAVGGGRIGELTVRRP